MKRVNWCFAGAMVWASLTAGAVQARIFDFSFSDSTDSGSGQFITTGSGPNYLVTNVTGVVDGDAITGISTYAFADNLLTFPPGEPADIGGIAFATAVDTYNIYSYTGGPWLIKYSVDPIGSDPNNGSPLSSFSVTAVPESSTWAMLLLGFAGPGYAGYRKSRKAITGAA